MARIFRGYRMGGEGKGESDRGGVLSDDSALIPFGRGFIEDLQAPPYQGMHAQAVDAGASTRSIGVHAAGHASRRRVLK